MKDALLSLLGVVLLLPFLVIAIKSILLRFWTLMFINECHGRCKVAYRIGWITAVTCWVLGTYTFGVVGFSAATFLVVAVTPWAATSLTTLWAWRHDDADDRIAALEIATERAVRHNETPPSLIQRWPWPDYIFDVEIARRRVTYEPPPI